LLQCRQYLPFIAQRNLVSDATLDHCRTASGVFAKSKELSPTIPTHYHTSITPTFFSL
jgi:hypothetical protein